MKKIIFADDDSAIQDVITLILDSEYKVTVFTKGEPLLRNEFDIPDLFLLDRQLPGVDGLDICRFLKGQDATKNIPVIMITATPNISALARSAGADGIIEKPFLIQELRQIIAGHITDHSVFNGK
jgi:DNA-binding response OmpR family regulator